jgi:hypothetical protein
MPSWWSVTILAFATMDKYFFPMINSLWCMSPLIIGTKWYRSHVRGWQHTSPCEICMVTKTNIYS